MKLGKFKIEFEWERNWRYWYMFDTFSTHCYRTQDEKVGLLTFFIIGPLGLEVERY